MESKITLKTTVYNTVFEDIIEGRYKPNEILTEGALVERFGVSKAPVREALIELCKDGILRSLPRLGYQIVPVTLQEMIDLLDFRVDLELSNLRRAAGRITESDIRCLRELQLNLGHDYSEEVIPHWSLNMQFHMALCQLSGNAYTSKVLYAALHQSSRFVSQYFKAAWSKARESEGRYHMAIVDALAAGDIATAEQMLRKDILDVKEEIQLSLK